MKYRFLLLPMLAISSAASAEIIDQALDIVKLSTGEKIIRWQCKPGRTYFVQISLASNHLQEWKWANIIESGNLEVSHEVDSTSDKAFFRLKYIDQVPGPNQTLESSDYDYDGLSNLSEITSTPQTDPLAYSTVGDEISDGWKLLFGFDPTDETFGNGDVDGDGYTDSEEYWLGLDPWFVENSDTDRFPDGWESHNGLDIFTHDEADDLDHDGLSNLTEYQLHTWAQVFDTDGDGLSDGFETLYPQLNPLIVNPPTIDWDQDGMGILFEAIYEFNPNIDDGSVDPDADGLLNREEATILSHPNEADVDADGLNDFQERFYGTDTWLFDTDYDTLPDKWEVDHQLSPVVGDDAYSDLDEDGLTLYLEYRNGTDPSNPDTDSDGSSDGVEVANNTGPTDGDWGGTPPVEPSNVQSVHNPDGTMTFSWTDNSTNERGFRIRYKLPSGEWILVADLPANTTTYTTTVQ